MSEALPESRLKFRIRYKLALSFSLLVLLVLTAFWLLLRSQLALLLQNQADALGETLAAQTAESVTELVLANDLVSLTVVLNQLVGSEAIDYVAVFNVDNQLIASAGSPPRLPGEAFINTSYSAPVALQDSIAGTVRLNLDGSALGAALARSSQLFLAILALGALFAVAAALALGNHLAAPLVNLVNALAARDPGAIPAPGRRSDEIALLEARCAELLEEAAEAEEDEFSATPAGEPPAAAPGSGLRLPATVLAIQVVNVGTAIELLHPSTLSRLLNEYGRHMQQAARLYGGLVQRFTGEYAVLGFDSRWSEEHAFNAVCCAQLFRLLMQKVTKRHRAGGSPALEFRLGIHSGEVFLAGGGGEARREVLMGAALDTAERLARHARPGQLLVSASSWAGAGGEERLRFRERLEIQGEADKQPLMAYSLADKLEGYSELLERQARHILPEPAGETGSGHGRDTQEV